MRLLDRTGEFTAEVPTSATGHFRFFAGDGEWTLRTLAPKAEPVDTRVVAATGSVAEVQVLVTRLSPARASDDGPPSRPCGAVRRILTVHFSLAGDR